MNSRFLSLILVIAAVAGGLIYQGTKTSASLVFEPSDLIAKGANASQDRIRVGGKVAKQGIVYQLQPEIILSFRVENLKDPIGSIPVIYKGLKPDMFAEGRDVIIDGDLEGGTLNATKLLTQCPSKYEPPVPESSGKRQYRGGARE